MIGRKARNEAITGPSMTLKPATLGRTKPATARPPQIIKKLGIASETAVQTLIKSMLERLGC